MLWLVLICTPVLSLHAGNTEKCLIKALGNKPFPQKNRTPMVRFNIGFYGPPVYLAPA